MSALEQDVRITNLEAQVDALLTILENPTFTSLDGTEYVPLMRADGTAGKSLATTFFEGRFREITANDVLAITDANGFISANGTGITLTIPNDLGMKNGSKTFVLQRGTGFSIAYGGSVTELEPQTLVDTDKSLYILTKIDVNIWSVAQIGTAGGGGGGGEANTGSNVGTDGIGVFKDKSGVTLRFKHIAPGSNKLSVAANGDDIDLDVVPSNINTNDLNNDAGFVTKVGTPENNQIVVWTGDGTAEGTDGITYNGKGMCMAETMAAPTGSAGEGHWYIAPTSPTTFRFVDSANNDILFGVLTGDVSKTDEGVVTIANEAVTNAKLAHIATQTIKGRNTAGTGDVEDLTGAQVLAIINGVGLTDTQTLTNKRITMRVQSVVSSATVTPNADNDDTVKITAQAVALTLANPSGTPTDMQPITIRIKDNGTARAITYGSEYRAVGVTLPTTTTINKTTYLGMVYNSDDTKWDVVGTNTEA